MNYLKIILLLCVSIGAFSCKTNPPKEIIEESKTESITVTGVAENAKWGAIVITTDNETYYVNGLDSWDDGLYQKKVKVSGTLKKVEHKAEDLIDEKGAFSQGMVGTQLIIENPKWELVK